MQEDVKQGITKHLSNCTYEFIVRQVQEFIMCCIKYLFLFLTTILFIFLNAAGQNCNDFGTLVSRNF